MVSDASWYRQVELADDVLDLVSRDTWGPVTLEVWHSEGDNHAFSLSPLEAVNLASALLQWATQNRGA